MTATALSIDYDALAARAEHDLPVQYDETDAMLYALAVGFGSDAQSSDALTIAASGTCGGGRQGHWATLLNRHPWRQVFVVPPS